MRKPSGRTWTGLLQQLSPHRWKRSLWLAGFLFVALLAGSVACDRKNRILAPTVGDLTLQVDGPVVRVRWTRLPTGSGSIVMRKLTLPPEGPNDTTAAIVYQGSGSEATDSLIALEPNTATNPHTYHYAVFPCDAGRPCVGNPSRATLAPTLLQCLRGGGYTIWWRHSSADVCADRLDLGTAATTSVPNWWKSCASDCPPSGTATARQLSAVGVAEATALGQTLDALQVPIGRVISSEYCRCFRTAELMDFGPVEQDSSISFFVYDEANRCAHSYERIQQIPAAGTNTALIGHAGFSGLCETIGSLEWSEAAIFKPSPAGGATLVARLMWEDWAQLP